MLPVSWIDGGIWNLSWEVAARALFRVTVMLRDIGDETMPTSDVIDTALSVLAVGVIDRVPDYILNPFLETATETDLGEASTRQKTTKSEILSTVPATIYGSAMETIVIRIC